MRGDDAGVTHGVAKKWRRHSLGQPSRKFFGQLGGDDGVRVTHSRGRGGGSGGRRARSQIL